MRTTWMRGVLRFLLVGTVVGLAAGTGTILAATKTWTGAGGDNFWTTAANWGGTVPVAGDDLVFPSGAARLTNTNNLTPGTSFNSISFTGPAGGYAISGNDIQLVAGLTADNSATNSVNLFIVLTASQTFTVSGDRLRLGAIELGSHTLTFAGASGIVELNGIVSGTGGISSSAGVVFLLVSASYTGPTTVTAGSFAVVGPSLSLSSVVTVNGGLLQYANGGRTGPVTVNAPGRLFCGGGATQLGSLTDLTMQSGSMLSMAMNSLSDYGQLNPASGNVSLGNATLDLGWSFTSITGDAFTIINKTSAGAITGTFAGLAEGATFTGNGRTYQITYVGGTGNDVVITDVTAGGPTPTPTPTATPTATPTPTPTVTPTSPPTPGPDIPTTGGGGAIAFMILLAVAGVLLVRRYTS